MKLKSLIFGLSMIALSSIANAQSERYNKLVWSEEFNKRGFIDPEKWVKAPRGGADWNDTMTDDERCYDVKNGKLILRGIINDDLVKDSVEHLTGGLTTQGKFDFTDGRIEVRVKMDSGIGAWPAIWLLGSEGPWPKNGEIDILEHLNNDKFIYQTVHTHYTYTLKHTKNPVNGGTAKFDAGKYNIVAVEMQPDKIVFFVNGEKTFEYPRIETDIEGQWPFDKPHYILFSQQLGGSWVGKVDNKDLPVEMKIDWVRVYK